jgi:hypothetical protein
MEITTQTQQQLPKPRPMDQEGRKTFGPDLASENGPKIEGPIARQIEEITAEFPSDTFLYAAGGAIVASLTLHAMGRQKTGNFIAQWVPTILICGVYNKLVKLHGHDRVS